MTSEMVHCIFGVCEVRLLQRQKSQVCYRRASTYTSLLDCFSCILTHMRTDSKVDYAVFEKLAARIHTISCIRMHERIRTQT